MALANLKFIIKTTKFLLLITNCCHLQIQVQYLTQIYYSNKLLYQLDQALIDIKV